MMKDVQGIQRGKCNTCDCEEYRSPPIPGQLRCEYCDHTPAEHVRIVELGACKQCGEDDCDKYVSDEPNSYSDCQYCGCSANQHEGSDVLRTSQPQRPQFGGGGGGGGGVVSVTAVFLQQPGGGIQPRVSQQGVPQQTAAFGTCIMPGCPFPKRIEGDTVHEYCSRTCAQKHRAMAASGHMQNHATAQQYGGIPQMGHPQGTYPPTSSCHPSDAPPTHAQPTGGPPTGAPPGNKLCKKCNTRYANPGRGWCQQCYLQSQSP